MIASRKGLVKRLSTVAVAVALGTAGASATAAIVTQWGFSTSATFTGATFTGVDSSNSFTPTELSWGRGDDFCLTSGGDLAGGLLNTPSGCGGSETRVSPDFENPQTSDPVFNNEGVASDYNRSALTIGTPGSLTGGGAATGVVNTVTDGNIGAGDFGLGINLTHWNNPISSGFRLASGQISDTLTLTPILPVAGAAVDAPDITFDFRFAETPNGGPCADGTSTPCADLFGIVAVPTLNLAFDYLGQEYFASVLLTDGMGGAAPIGTLGVQECAAVNLGAGCQGFRTAESQATTIQFAFAVSTTPVFVPVPAPAPLALLGLGVLGLGLSRRRGAAKA